MSLSSKVEENVDGRLILPIKPNQLVEHFIEVKLKENHFENVKNCVNAKLETVDNNLEKEDAEKEEKNNMRALQKLASKLGFANDENVNTTEWFFGVYIPNDVRIQYGDEPVHVYTDKVEALKVMKQSKKARFKQFKTWNEAADFAQNGAELPTPTTPSQQPIGGEKPSSFKGPKPQDLVQFRKAIEAGDIEAVRTTIEENPRYLFSSGDTPSILQEGCRYNALHVAAKANQAAIAELILSYVTSLPFLAKLYDDPSEDALRRRSTVLLDLYLNMPDKSWNETPLHFAVKHGNVEIVELLTSYPQCQRGLVNKYNQTVQELVCTRASEDGGKKKEAILSLLQERFFLPVLRFEDNSMQPRVGEAFSPSKPLELRSDPLSPRLEMQAYVGPMSKSQVEEFRKKWRTPPATMRSSSHLSDPEKGLERVGRNLAHELKVPWREYWSFLDTFVDLASPEGLKLLEKYLNDRFDDTYKEVMSPVIEVSEKKINKSGNGLVEDYLSPVSDLCQALQACTLDDISPKKHNRRDRDRKYRRKADAKFSPKTEEIAEKFAEGSQHFSSLLYVERSCQVFGKRIANVMLNSCSTVDVNAMGSENLRDGLEPEVKHLQSLITGYLEDSRFNMIDFSVVHTRVAAVASHEIRDLITPSEQTVLLACLKEIALADGTMSDDEDILFTSRRDDHTSAAAVLKTHLLCLTGCLLSEVVLVGGRPASVQNEDECEVVWSRAAKCACKWEAMSHLARARANFRRKLKLTPKLLNFKTEDESSSVEESWRSCEEPAASATSASDDEKFETPPSTPPRCEDEFMEDTFSMPDTFIYPGDEPTKTDLAVLDAISECNITPHNYPAIYRWRHLVQLHADTVVPSPNNSHSQLRRLGSATPTTPARRISQSSKEAHLLTPVRANWERVTGSFSPRRPGSSTPTSRNLLSPR